MAAEFVHLHVHSEYSLLDGCARVRSIPERAASLGMQAVALTDHGALHGAVQFARAAEANGVKPIIGCELYVAPDGQSPERNGSRGTAYHLTVLAANADGYRNLIRLSSLGYLEGFYYRPRVTKEQLAEHKAGLIVLSGCLAGEVPTLLAAGHYEQARSVAEWFRDVFGREAYFLELMDHGLDEQRLVNQGLLRLHNELGLEVVATNDAHYLQPEDASAQEILTCIQTGKRLDDPDRLTFESDQLYLKSPQEMRHAFSGAPRALQNTLAIAERCSFRIEEGEAKLPSYSSVNEAGSGPELLRRLVFEGLARRYPSGYATAEARARHELAVIEETGFTDYFLIVWDLIRHARGKGIAVGPGRGSSASSVVAYALEITDVDPLAYGLVFERFLNPERVTMPDIDMDFCFERRHEVIEYVAERYGAERVAQIGTFGTLAARAAVRDVGRVLGLPYSEVDRIAKLIPAGGGVTLDQALDEAPELRAAYRETESFTKLVDTSRKVEGSPRHLSVHAAGIVVSPAPLVELIPLCTTSDGTTITQYVGEDLEALGFLKLDLLGLRTLTVIDKAVALITERQGTPLEIRRIPLDDPEVYRTLATGETEGVFQLETGMFRSLLRDVVPQSFEDLIAILALGRPGPMARLGDYLRYRRGEATPEYPHPAMEAVLAETSGIMLYQEQVMRIATDLAGYTPGQADLLRRAMGKKIPEMMDVEEGRFVRAAVERGLDERTARAVFTDIARFAEYGFPKSHSAAYALVAYQTAYLKTHFPHEFMAALLSSVMSVTGRAGRYLQECRRIGIPVAGPDVNESAVDFTVQDGAIRFGLAAVKHVGRTLAEQVLHARANSAFQTLEEFCSRVPSSLLHRKALESLIRVGAFASTGISRKEGLDRFDQALQSRGRLGAHQDQIALFEGGQTQATRVVDERSELQTDEMLMDEIELLGAYVSTDPLAPYREVLLSYRLPEHIVNSHQGPALAGGVVVQIQETRTRTGRSMAFVTLQDIEGRICEVVLFPQVYSALHGLRPGSVLVAKGRAEEDEGNAKLLADEVRMLEGEPLEIHVASASRLKALHGSLRRHPGGRPVILCVSTDRVKARLVLPPRFWVQRDYGYEGAFE